MTSKDLLRVVVALAAAATLPLFVAANTALNFAVFTLIIALAAQGWNILAGFGGGFSFGHAAFFGTGAYATALLQARTGINAWAAFAGGIALGALVGRIIGGLAFRAGLRGSYFALVTLAFAEVFRILANAWDFTGGAAGVLTRLDPRPANMQFADRGSFYWLALAFVGAALLLTARVASSRFGARLVALRENEDAARALGVDVVATKLHAITLSAGVTAAAGGLYAQYFLFVDPGIAYGTWISVEALLAPIIGGLGTVWGPVIGAVALHGLGQLAKGAAGAVPGVDLVAYGVLLILAVAFAPRGLLGLLRGPLDRVRGARR